MVVNILLGELIELIAGWINFIQRVINSINSKNSTLNPPKFSKKAFFTLYSINSTYHLIVPTALVSRASFLLSARN